MLAAVLHGAKDLKLEPVEERPLAADEVRLAFRAGGICGSDLAYYFKGPSATCAPARSQTRSSTF